MRPLPKPAFNPGDVFATCISRVRNNALRTRLTACSQFIIEAEEEFDEKAIDIELHTIATADNINGVVTVKAEMTSIYDDRMAKKASAGRPIYDVLLSAAPLGRCPLCSHRSVSTLDHHLAKALYPSLAVCPYNLIPACWECNKIKRQLHPHIQEEETLNPYYDNIEDAEWLFAKVLENTPPNVLFSVKAPETWDNLLKARVEYHFGILGINNLYSSNAAGILTGRRHHIITHHNRGGIDEVQQFLTESYQSYADVNVNSWQSACYKALLESDWYCDGGFDF